MPSGYFPQNMAILRRLYPLLAEELSRAEDAIAEGELKVETAASGVPTLLVRLSGSGGGLHIHSKRDPEREAERLVEGAADAHTACARGPAIVLGFGLGYAVSALVAKFPGRPIIIAEKYPAMLKKALEVRDMQELLSRNQLVFVLGGNGEGIAGALALFESSPGVLPLIIQNRALIGIDQDWYAGVEERIRTWNSQNNVNQATRKRFGKRWVRNLSRNLGAIRDIPGISRLEGILRGRDIPVFLAAAGPTLDMADPILGEIFKRCLIVAVDTSLRFLLARSITPDFVVSVDPQYWNFRHLDRVPAPKTRLVTESAVYPPLFRHHFGGVFLCGSFFPLGRFIEDRVDPKGDLGTGGSVATSAWDFIRLLGSHKVWIAGLDLSFPNLKTHFRGALFEEKSHAESCRFFPGETWNFRALRDGQPFRAKRKGGGTVLTDKRLSLYAAWFENRFSRFPAIKNYTLQAEGLDLKGLETAAEEEFFALPERREDIDRLLGEVYASVGGAFGSEEAKKSRAEKYENARAALLGGLKDIKNLAEDAARNAGLAAGRSRHGGMGGREQERALKKLDAANKAVTESAVKEIAGFLFPETEDWEAEIATENTLVRHLEFSSRFYRALAEAAGYNLQALE